MGTCWKPAGVDQGEFDQNVVFDRPKHVKAMSIQMRKPGKDGYFGIIQVGMQPDREDPVMLVNGPSPKEAKGVSSQAAGQEEAEGGGAEGEAEANRPVLHGLP